MLQQLWGMCMPLYTQLMMIIRISKSVGLSVGLVLFASLALHLFKQRSLVLSGLAWPGLAIFAPVLSHNIDLPLYTESNHRFSPVRWLLEFKQHFSWFHAKIVSSGTQTQKRISWTLKVGNAPKLIPKNYFGGELRVWNIARWVGTIATLGGTIIMSAGTITLWVGTIGRLVGTIARLEGTIILRAGTIARLVGTITLWVGTIHGFVRWHHSQVSWHKDGPVGTKARWVGTRDGSPCTSEKALLPGFWHHSQVSWQHSQVNWNHSKVSRHQRWVNWHHSQVQWHHCWVWQHSRMICTIARTFSQVSWRLSQSAAFQENCKSEF